MSIVKQRVTKLALIVGGNPLPNYLAVQLLQPREIVFFYTSGDGNAKDSRQIMHRLQKALEATADKTPGHQGYTFYEERVDHRAIPEKITTAVRRARSTHKDIDHLHYSGGTKPMATHIHAELSRKFLVDPKTIVEGLKTDQLSYMDEADGVLRYDDGTELGLDSHEINLSLEVLRDLHGVETKTPPKVDYFNSVVDGFPTKDDARKVTAWWVDDVANNRVIFRQKRFLQERHVKDLSFYDHFDTYVRFQQAKGERKAAWMDFLDSNGWLEQWTGYAMQDLLTSGGTLENIEVGREYFLVDAGEGRRTEIDVAFIHKHRFHLISCTSHKDLRECKAKVFEAITRAQQLGGEMARAALMCLLTDDSVHRLKADATATGIDMGAVAVFGLDHVRALLNPTSDDSQPYLHDVKEWLGLEN